MLEVKNLTKIYKPKKGVPVRALDNVSITFQSTGMVFVLGKSGSGKSTLLNLLGGLDTADQGEIVIKGKSSKDFSQSDFDSYRNTYVGFIFQEYNILEEFTVGANIALAMELQGKKATNEAIDAILEQVDMAGYGNRKPNELSGGQMQRVAIARALVKSPEIIMADEPTGALDSKTGIQVFNTLKKLSKDKLVIVVSHDREFAEMYGDRIIEFEDGRVISDVVKDVAEGEVISKGVQVIDDQFIHVKKGYQLTAEDLTLINQYLNTHQNDIVISMNEQTNHHVKRMAKIDDAGNREVFRPTDQEKIAQTINRTDQFKLIKSKLPLKDSIKIGASGIKGKPVRLFFTILLSFVAFTLFGLADTMGSYNKEKASVQSIIDSQVRNLTVEKSMIIRSGTWSYSNKMNMTKEDVENLKDTWGYAFKPVFRIDTWSSISPYYYDYSGLEEDGEYYTGSLSGFVELTDQDVQDIGFTLYGNMPTQPNEVAISKYLFDHFAKAGYKEDENNFIEAKDLNQPTELIGKTISLGSETYKITGIIDTNFDPTGRYDSIKNMKGGGGISEYLKIMEFQSYVQYGYHTLAYVAPGTIDGFLDKKVRLGSELPDYIQLHLNGELQENDKSYYYYSPEFVARVSDLSSDNLLFFNQSKQKLEPNEVLVNFQDVMKYSHNMHSDAPKSLLDKFNAPEHVTTFIDLYDHLEHEYMYQYAEENFETAYAKGLQFPDWEEEIEPSDGAKINFYLDYLMNEGYLENPFGDKTGVDIKNQMIKDFINETNPFSSSYFQNITNYYHNGLKGIYEDTPVTIVGFYLPTANMFVDNQHYHNEIPYMIIDDEFYAELEQYKVAPFDRVIAPMPQDEASIREVVKKGYEIDDNNIAFELQNEVYFYLSDINSMIEELSKVFLYIGIVFAVFASLLLFNFITTSITQKKRDIGVLRALGSRSSDVFGIFYNESLIIALLNYVLSVIATIVIVGIINSWLRTEYDLLITFLNFGFRQIILMLVVSIGVATISSFLPTYRISRKKPIDAIRNR